MRTHRSGRGDTPSDGRARSSARHCDRYGIPIVAFDAFTRAGNIPSQRSEPNCIRRGAGPRGHSVRRRTGANAVCLWHFDIAERVEIAVCQRHKDAVGHRNTHTSLLQHCPMVTFPVAVVAKNRGPPFDLVARTCQGQPKIAATLRRPFTASCASVHCKPKTSPLFPGLRRGVLRRG